MSPSITNVESKLKFAIAQILDTIPHQQKNEAFKKLSACYRSHTPSKVSRTAASSLFLSYIGGRMPATFAVVGRVLSEYLLLGGEIPSSLVDLGAGPATASFAAINAFGELRINLVEKESSFKDVALDLAKRAQIQPLIDGTWHLADVAAMEKFLPSDLCIASYSLGEMKPDTAKRVAMGFYQASRLGCIILEPGTPTGFMRIRELRDAFIEVGAYIAAPCPHPKGCPMTGEDFCHFSERLQREEFHRVAKNAKLPYEDEKFSYLIVSKKPLKTYEGRLVKRPIKSSGHVTLDICSDGKLVRNVVARSNKSLYKIARKSEWGDRIDLG